jgi:hypothetical protein
MEDFNAYLYNEIRHLAFRKSSEQVTWQDAIKQQRETDIENRLCKIASDNSLAGFTKALAGQFSVRHPP